MALTLGTLSGYAGRGTLAFFTSTVVSQQNAFSGGVVDIAGLMSNGSTASVLTTAAFSWTASGASGSGATSSTADCRNILTGLEIRDQRMTPGDFCVAKIDLNNNNSNAVDAWMRMRVVRATPYLATGDAQVDAATESLNDRLKLYMHEYSGGASASVNKTARDADCNTTNYKPTWTTTGLVGGTALTVGQSSTVSSNAASYVFGSSSAQIFNGTVSGSVTRTALSTLGEMGKNLGANTGISALTVSGTPVQDSTVLGLQTPRPDSGTLAAVTTASPNGLRLKAGTSAAGSGTSGVLPAETNMATALGATPNNATSITALSALGGNTVAGARNAYNLAGNDEVTNPIKILSTTTNTSATPLTVTSSSVTALTTSNAGTAANVTVAFTPSAVWTANGQVVIDFPVGYTLGTLGTTSLSGVDGTLTATKNGQQVTVTRSGGTDVAASTAVSFALTGVTFPTMPTDTTSTANGNPANAQATWVAAYNTPAFRVLSPPPSTTGAAVSGTSTTVANRNGTEAHGTDFESEINKGQQRYYCAAIFFPSDTDSAISTVYANTTAVGFGVGLGKTYDSTWTTSTYESGVYDYTAGRYKDYTAGTAGPLGTVAAAVTAANGKGDNAAGGGDVRYYFVVSAAQKAGRTVN